MKILYLCLIVAQYFSKYVYITRIKYNKDIKNLQQKIKYYFKVIKTKNV